MSDQNKSMGKKQSGEGISNRTVLALLLATLAVSLGGTFITLSTLNERLAGVGLEGVTGYALIPNGTASLTITTSSSIRFTADTVAFGSGFVNGTSGNNCTLTTMSGTGYANTPPCASFTELNHGFTVENDGNTNLTVELQSNRTATQFIGIDSALFLWNVTLNETGSCVNKSGTARSAVSPNTTDANQCSGSNCGAIFEAVSAGAYKVICQSLLYDDTKDALDIDINITIPIDAPAGGKQAGLIVRGTVEP